jgi:hypothetical protein
VLGGVLLHEILMEPAKPGQEPGKLPYGKITAARRLDGKRGEG